MSEWISVNDRIPTVAGEYLVRLCNPDGVCICICNAYYSTARHEWFSVGAARLKDVDVTHWMPLPEEPEQEDRNEEEVEKILRCVCSPDSENDGSMKRNWSDFFENNCCVRRKSKSLY